MEVRRRLGANVKALRKARGLSQERFGFESGLDRTYISGIERGVRNPTILIVERIAVAFGVPAAALLTEPTKRGRRD
jgi:transcriptional regulator with XRE-family HTH domain